MGISEAGAAHNSPAQLTARTGHAGHEWPQEMAGRFPSVRYRGFVLIPQADLSWLIRPERSPMRILPFRAPASSLTDVKALVDWRLAQHEGR